MKIIIDVLSDGAIPIYDIGSKATCIGNKDFKTTHTKLLVPLHEPTAELFRSIFKNKINELKKQKFFNKGN